MFKNEISSILLNPYTALPYVFEQNVQIQNKIEYSIYLNKMFKYKNSYIQLEGYRSYFNYQSLRQILLRGLMHPVKNHLPHLLYLRNQIGRKYLITRFDQC